MHAIWEYLKNKTSVASKKLWSYLYRIFFCKEYTFFLQYSSDTNQKIDKQRKEIYKNWRNIKYTDVGEHETVLLFFVVVLLGFAGGYFDYIFFVFFVGGGALFAV